MKRIEFLAVFSGLMLLTSIISKIAVAEEEMPASVGPGKAVTAVNEHQGIRLSDRAKATIGYQSSAVGSTAPLSVPTSSLVYYQNHVGVYVVRDDWNKLIEVQVTRKSPTEALVKSAQIKSGDQIVTGGVALLRAAELDAFADHDDEGEKVNESSKEKTEKDHD